MSGAKRVGGKGSGRGGWRPGAGRKPKIKPLLTTADLEAVVRRELKAQQGSRPPATSTAAETALVQHLAAINKELRTIARQSEREPLLRRLAAIERAVGLLEPPQTPRLTRRRPLE